MKNKLSQKLAGYSGLTTAILLSAQHLNAQIIYTDISDVKINFNNPYHELDLNNDGIADYAFEHDYNTLGVTSSCYPLNDCNDNSIRLNGSDLYISKLSFLDVIGPAGYWKQPSSYAMFLAYSSISSQAGLWQGGVLNGYTALRLNLSGNSYYGWMRCFVKKDASLLIIKDYAYNSVPGMPILAGDEGCSDNFEPNNSKPQATTIQINNLVRAQIENVNDIDWYSFSISGNDNNARIVLSSLLKNYDIKLVDQNGNQIAKSANIGGNNDTIVFNGLATANYYVKVYGKNGNFSSVDCYSLFVETSANPFRESDSQIFDNNSNELTVFPNPVSESATIQFSIENASSVTIDLFDLQGRKIQSITEENFQAGIHQLNFSAADLTAGIYYLKLRTGIFSNVIKLFIQ